MTLRDKCFGSPETRPASDHPLCGRWTRTQAAIASHIRNAAGSIEAAYPASLSGHAACVVNTLNSSLAVKPPCVFGMAAQRFGDRRTPRPTVAMPRMTKQPHVRQACTRFRCETGQDNHPAQRHAAVSRFRKGPAPAVHTSGVGGAGPDQVYRVGPAGTARTSSRQRQALASRDAGFGLARRMSGPASRSNGAPVYDMVRSRHAAPGQIVDDLGLFAMASRSTLTAVPGDAPSQTIIPKSARAISRSLAA